MESAGGCERIAASDDGSLIAVAGRSSVGALDAAWERTFAEKMDGTITDLSAAARGGCASVAFADRLIVHHAGERRVILRKVTPFRIGAAQLRPDGLLIAVADAESGVVRMLGMDGEEAASPRVIPGGFKGGRIRLQWVEVSGEPHLGVIDSRRWLLFNSSAEPCFQATCGRRVHGFSSGAGRPGVLTSRWGGIRLVGVVDGEVIAEARTHWLPLGLGEVRVVDSSSGWLSVAAFRGRRLYTAVRGRRGVQRTILPDRATDLAFTRCGMVVAVSTGSCIDFYFNAPAAVELFLGGDPFEQTRAAEALCAYGREESLKLLGEVEGSFQTDGMRSEVIKAVIVRLDAAKRRAEADRALGRLARQDEEMQASVREALDEHERALEQAERDMKGAEARAVAIRRRIRDIHIRTGAYSAELEGLRRGLGRMEMEIRRKQGEKDEIELQIAEWERQEVKLSEARAERASVAERLGDARILEGLDSRLASVESRLRAKRDELATCETCLTALGVRRDELLEEIDLTLAQEGSRPFDRDHARRILDGLDRFGRMIGELRRKREAEDRAAERMLESQPVPRARESAPAGKTGETDARGITA